MTILSHHITQVAAAAERTERALGAERVAHELRARMRQMETDMLNNEKNTFDITAEMSRQFKGMQESLMAKINLLEHDIHKLKDDLGEHSISAQYRM